MHPKFYIAAPFFNAGQTALVKRIEQTFDSVGVPIFSPRGLHDDFDDAPPPIDTPEAAANIFKLNLDSLRRCQVVLAVLDYNLLPGQTMRIVTSDDGIHGPDVSKPIRIPDVGTTFEAGYARGQGIPVVGFTQQTPDTLNVMLAAAMRGVIYSVPELLAWLQVLVKERDLGRTFMRLQQWGGTVR